MVEHVHRRHLVNFTKPLLKSGSLIVQFVSNNHLHSKVGMAFIFTIAVPQTENMNNAAYT